MHKNKNICRVCSSFAEYDIFAVIPVYLHAIQNDFAYWNKKIYHLLEEITGMKIYPDDGLPQKICALCISYLKHASTFRDQAIENILSIRAAAPDHLSAPRIKMAGRETSFKQMYLTLISSDEKNLKTKSTSGGKSCIFDNTQKNHNDSKAFGSDKENNRDFSHISKYLRSENDVKICLNVLFDKDLKPVTTKAHYKKPKSSVSRKNSPNYNNLNNSSLKNKILREDSPTGSSEDNEVRMQNNYFSYKEKNFEEDDIMSFDDLKDANITVRIPEQFKERKCRACFRRFMFDESFNEHTNVCLEYQFMLHVEEINRLSVIRSSKRISPHEYIRRMIYSFKKTCHWLHNCCGEVFPASFSHTERNMKSELKKSAVKSSSFCKFDDGCCLLSGLPKMKNDTEEFKIINHIKSASNPAVCVPKIINEDPLLALLKQKINPTTTRKMNLDSENELHNAIDYNTIQAINNDFYTDQNNSSHPKINSFCSESSPPHHSFTTSSRICYNSYESIGALNNHRANYDTYSLMQTQKRSLNKTLISIVENNSSNTQ